MRGDSYNCGPSCDNSGGRRRSVSKYTEIKPGMKKP